MVLAIVGLSVFTLWGGRLVQDVNAERAAITARVRVLIASRELERNLDEGTLPQRAELDELRLDAPDLDAEFTRMEQQFQARDVASLRDAVYRYESAVRRENAEISARLGERWDALGGLVVLAVLLGVMTTTLLALVGLREQHLERALAQAGLLQERAERAERMKDRLLANTAHELRTPLAGMLGLLELAQEGETDRIPEAIEHGYRLASLLSDLLDLARMQSGHSTFLLEPVALEALLRSTVIEPLSTERTPIRTTFDLPPWLSLDPRRVVQVVGNLVSNASRHAADQPIDVAVRWQDGLLTLVVEDRGPGLGPDPQSLFEAFTQGETPHARGLGIGLTVVNETVLQWGGRITAGARPGGGARFEVVLPCQVTEAPPTRSGVTAPPWAVATVLVVEDDPTLALVTSRMLQTAGYRIQVCTSGEAALETLETMGSPPLAAVIDWQLPGIDGPETARRIRALGLRTPLVALTARGTPGDIAVCMEAGFDAHLAKPVHPRELLETLGELIGPEGDARG